MIPYGGPYVCRGCGVHHTHENPCEAPETAPADTRRVPLPDPTTDAAPHPTTMPHITLPGITRMGDRCVWEFGCSPDAHDATRPQTPKSRPEDARKGTLTP